jgi:hypothetical protein
MELPTAVSPAMSASLVGVGQLPVRLFREGPPQGDAKARPAAARSFDHAPRFRLSLSSLAVGKQKETIDASLWFR